MKAGPERFRPIFVERSPTISDMNYGEETNMIGPIGNSNIYPAAPAPSNSKPQPAAPQASSSPQDTVQLSPAARSAGSSGDVDHDGDSH